MIVLYCIVNTRPTTKTQMSSRLIIQYNTIQYSHLADAFIQSDVQKLLVDGKKRDSMSLDLRPVSGTL